MRVTKAEAKKIYFDNYGQRRYFSADIEVSGGHQSLPAFAFPDAANGEEDKLKEKFKNLFQFEQFNEENVGFPIHVIEDGCFLFGLVNHLGQIFSMDSIYSPEDRMNKDIQKYLPKLKEAYPGIEEQVSQEDMRNAVVALYLLDNKDNPITVKSQHYYSMLLLRNDLTNNLENEHTDKPRMKV
jgi:hypothetical protein